MNLLAKLFVLVGSAIILLHLTDFVSNLKVEKDPPANLSDLAQQAVDQIMARRYNTKMSAKGAIDIAMFGIVFRDKNIEILI